MSQNPQKNNYNYNNNNNSGNFTKLYPNSKNYLLWIILVCCVYITIVQFSLCCGGIKNSIGGRKYLSLNMTAAKTTVNWFNERDIIRLNYTLNNNSDNGSMYYVHSDIVYNNNTKANSLVFRYVVNTSRSNKF